jgi:hypothetical protein
MNRVVLIVCVVVPAVGIVACGSEEPPLSTPQVTARSTSGPCPGGQTTVTIRVGQEDCVLDPAEPYEAYAGQPWCWYNDTADTVHLKTKVKNHGVFLFTEDLQGNPHGNPMNESIKAGHHLLVWLSLKVEKGDEYDEDEFVTCRERASAASQEGSVETETSATFRIVDPPGPALPQEPEPTS